MHGLMFSVFFAGLNSSIPYAEPAWDDRRSQRSRWLVDVKSSAVLYYCSQIRSKAYVHTSVASNLALGMLSQVATPYQRAATR